jgi:hypothetical protein
VPHFIIRPEAAIETETWKRKIESCFTVCGYSVLKVDGEIRLLLVLVKILALREENMWSDIVIRCRDQQSTGICLETMDRQADGLVEIDEWALQRRWRFRAYWFQWRSIEGIRVGCLPLILARGLMKDVLLAVNGEDTIFHNALPVDELAEDVRGN